MIKKKKYLLFGLGGIGCKILSYMSLPMLNENYLPSESRDFFFLTDHMSDFASYHAKYEQQGGNQDIMSHLENHFFDLSITQAELAELYRSNLKKQTFFTRENDNLIYQLINGMNFGSGVNRVLGRMAFDSFINKNALKIEMQKIVQRDFKVKVIIISSLFGGLGSSGILPIAAYLKTLLLDFNITEDEIEIEIIGVAPPNKEDGFFSTELLKLYKAMSFATSKELNDIMNINAMTFKPNIAYLYDKRKNPDRHVNKVTILKNRNSDVNEFYRSIAISIGLMRDEYDEQFLRDDLLFIDLTENKDYFDCYYEIETQLHIDTRWDEERIRLMAKENSTRRIRANFALEEERTVFLSYSSKEEDLADIVDSVFSNIKGLTVTRYTRDVKYKDSFKDFMKKVKKHDFVIMLISDNFLKSQACMFEVSELLTDDEFKQKLLFIIISDGDAKHLKITPKKPIGAKIYSAVNRNEYVVYWEDQYETVKASFDKIKSESAKIEPAKQLREISRIINQDLSPFLDYLSDACGQSFEEAYSNEFISLRTAMNIASGSTNQDFKETENGL